MTKSELTVTLTLLNIYADDVSTNSHQAIFTREYVPVGSSDAGVTMTVPLNIDTDTFSLRVSATGNDGDDVLRIITEIIDDFDPKQEYSTDLRDLMDPYEPDYNPDQMVHVLTVGDIPMHKLGLYSLRFPALLAGDWS